MILSRGRRRLAYVAITRAKKSFVSFAIKSLSKVIGWDSLPSRFVNELPEKNIEKNELKNNNFEEFDVNQDLFIEQENECGARMGKIQVKRF